LGEKIPKGWALNKDGEPTEDPGATFPEGSLTPFGEYKGYGLAVVMEILSGVMTGARFGTNLEVALGPGIPEQIGHLYAVLDMGAFIPLSDAKHRADLFIRQVKTSNLLKGVESVYLPGEIEHRVRAEHLEKGIPMDKAIQCEIENLASKLGISIEWENVKGQL